MEESRNLTASQTVTWRIANSWSRCIHICYEAQTILWGIVSALLYLLLYAFEESILDWSEQGGWFFLVPIATAFVFSLVHGTFTGYFWDVLGVKAKSVKK